MPEWCRARLGVPQCGTAAESTTTMTHTEQIAVPLPGPSRIKGADARMSKLAAFPRVNPNPVLEFNADGTLSYANDAAFKLAKSLGKEQILDILPAGAASIVVECLAGSTKRLREEVCCNERTITWTFYPVAGSHV